MSVESSPPGYSSPLMAGAAFPNRDFRLESSCLNQVLNQCA
jgi:hypothetical protein